MKCLVFALQLLREALRTCHFHAGVNYKEECAKVSPGGPSIAAVCTKLDATEHLYFACARCMVTRPANVYLICLERMVRVFVRLAATIPNATSSLLAACIGLHRCLERVSIRPLELHDAIRQEGG